SGVRAETTPAKLGRVALGEGADLRVPAARLQAHLSRRAPAAPARTQERPVRRVDRRDAEDEDHQFARTAPRSTRARARGWDPRRRPAGVVPVPPDHAAGARALGRGGRALSG